jgi:hypothetical protein
MSKSGLLKLPNHKETKTELGMWKKSVKHINCCNIKHELYCCQLQIVANAEQIFELTQDQAKLSCNKAANTII